MSISSNETEKPERGEQETTARLETARAALEERMNRLVAGPDIEPPHLRDALHHALLSPGKRVRPLLLLMIAARDSGASEAALDAGIAVEMVHTASLVLDDLPSMDNAETRRKRPTAHVLFGEATAILVAIALLNRAFGLLAELGAGHEIRTELGRILSNSIGWNGLVSGQAHDIAGNQGAERADAERVNWLKTGALFVAAAEMGAVLGGCDEADRARIVGFANYLGQAFQTADDLIDISGDPEAAGKDVGKDHGKQNVVSIVGAKRARDACREYLTAALDELGRTGIPQGPIFALMEQHFGAMMPGNR